MQIEFEKTELKTVFTPTEH